MLDHFLLNLHCPHFNGLKIDKKEIGNEKEK